MVALETAAEIIAKKIFFRGASFQPHDMFDLAAVAESYDDAYVIDALKQCGLDRCKTALAVVERAKPEFVQSIIGQLMYREKNSQLVTEAHGIPAEFCKRLLQAMLPTNRNDPPPSKCPFFGGRLSIWLRLAA